VIEISSTETYAQGWDQWPLGVRQLVAYAERYGWSVRTGFSRGQIPGQKTDSWVTRDMIGVWLDGYGHRAVAWWERNPDARFTAKKLDTGIKAGEIPSGLKWTSSATAIWQHGRRPGAPCYPYANLTEIREWLEVCGMVDAGFWDRARERVLAARAASAVKSRTQVTKQREHA
jgi:hypothetical protein